MSQTNKESLIEFLNENGQIYTWSKLAEMFNLPHGEIARNIWYRYRKNTGERFKGDVCDKTKKEKEISNYIQKAEHKITEFVEDCKTGKAEMKAVLNEEIKSLADLETLVDTSRWEISKYVQNCWSGKFQVKAWLEPKSVETRFSEFLRTYTPKTNYLPPKKTLVKGLPDACLIINKQDAHLNKYDVDGDNDINVRFEDFEFKIDRILKKATASANLDKIIYAIGSDEFNSEFTNCTTHGTPQQNILDYNRSFEAICEHEIMIITQLLSVCPNVDVIYIPGNHDNYVGWHLVQWLKAYFRNIKTLTIDPSDKYTKYIKWSNSAFCFNHGYKVKPEALAKNFPIEFRSEWSNCDNYYIFTGDLHTEYSKQIGGIDFYRLAQVSNSTSKWDQENGYTLSKGRLTGFLIEENQGVTDIYKI